MEPRSIFTREILFPAGEVRTDSMLYREKCRLLLPESYTQNMFFVQSSQFQTRFFIASESTRNLEMMEAFFSRMYGAVFEDSQLPEVGGNNSVILKNSILNLRKKEFYHPGFIRNILDYTAVDRTAVIRYCVSVRSGGSGRRYRGRFNFTVTIGFDSEHTEKKLSDLLSYEMKAMKHISKYYMKKSGRPKMRDNLLSNPFNLINFIRVPSERDILL